MDMKNWASGFFEETKVEEKGTELKNYRVCFDKTWFIIDWDDTLLPTTRLAKSGINLDTPMLTPEQIAELEAVDTAASDLLRKIINFYGKVLIVTNAQQGWVELSSRKFLPETHELIFAPANSSCFSFSSSSSGFNNDPDHDENSTLNLPSFSLDFIERTQGNGPASSFSRNTASNGRKRARMSTNMEVDEDKSDTDALIKVFSAREMYERAYKENPSMWKVKAFANLLKCRISSEFFSAQTISKSMSEDSISRKRSNSISGLSSVDLSDLVEVEDGSFEVEMDFNETDSFFSFGFQPSDTEELDEFEERPAMKEHIQADQREKRQIPACNLISIGDCRHDCESLQHLELNLKDTLKKTVKFREFPSPSQLIRELHELGNNLNRLVKATRDVHLVVSNRSYD